jgi:hypothetical protein
VTQRKYLQQCLAHSLTPEVVIHVFARPSKTDSIVESNKVDDNVPKDFIWKTLEAGHSPQYSKTCSMLVSRNESSSLLFRCVYDFTASPTLLLGCDEGL